MHTVDARRGNVQPRTVQQRKIPEAILALDVLPSDYIDVFTATVSHGTDASPDQWARATMEGAPPVGRFLAWQFLLNLRLESHPSPDYVAGWRIAARGDNWIRLEATAWSMTANIVFLIEEEKVHFATLIRYDRRVAAAIWTPVSAIHRRVAPGFLGGGVKRISRGEFG